MRRVGDKFTITRRWDAERRQWVDNEPTDIWTVEWVGSKPINPKLIERLRG